MPYVPHWADQQTQHATDDAGPGSDSIPPAAPGDDRTGRIMVAWTFLLLAISAEVIGTLALRQLADGISAVPLTIVIIGYAASFLLMIPALKTINVGVSYAVWSAVGTAAVAGIGAVVFHERLNALGIAGLVIIVIGVVALTASGNTAH